MSHCIGDIADATDVYCPLECTPIEHRILSIDDLTFCEFYSGSKLKDLIFSFAVTNGQRSLWVVDERSSRRRRQLFT